MFRRSRQHPDAIARMEMKSIRHYHVVVVQRRQRNVQKSAIHVQSCYFVYLILSLFRRSRCRRRRRCSLKLSKEASAEERNCFPYNRPHRPNRSKFPKLKSLVSRRLYGTEPGLINCPQIYSAPVNMKLVYYLPSIRRVDWT